MKNTDAVFFLEKTASETHMNSNGSIDYVLLDDDTRVDCDLVIVAAGVRPAVECVLDTPIEVDRFIKCLTPWKPALKIFTLPVDVTGLSGIWPNAMKQGQVAALNMCGIETAYDDRYAMKIR